MMRSSHVDLYLASFGLLLTLVRAQQAAALPSLLEPCCETGKAWFSVSRERCSLHPGPFEGISAGMDSMSCQAVVEVCCLREKRDKQCTQGKQISRIRQNCDALHSQLGNMHARECCSCCKLGQVARDAALSCSLLDERDAYTNSCKATFKECCIGDNIISTTTTSPATVAPPQGQNECELFSNQLCAHICIDTPDSYRCSCNAGYTLQADGRTCKQAVTDRCQIHNPCQHLCVDTGVAINCKCLDGFILKPDGRTCEDEDECKIGTHTCEAHQKCVNSPGAFACEGISRPSPSTCPRGYVYNSITRSCEDLDECRLTPRGLCRAHQMCVNTGGSYTCVARNPNDHTACEQGFNFNIATKTCEDVDECRTGRHNCHTKPHQICQNRVGSYICRCDRGYRTDPSSRQCADINECVLNQDACLVGQNCENTEGSYECQRGINCGTGYTLDRSTQTCKDDDECAMGTHNCGLGRACQNSQGSFRCIAKRCPPGTRLDFTTGECSAVSCPRGLRPDRAGNCVDVNECIDSSGTCRAYQHCFNTIGSYSCRNLLTCGQGYELNEQGNACIDINECERGTDDCKGELMTCVNRRGTYMCDCPDGYRTNHRDRRCEDIDECTRYGGQVCSPNSQCENTQGSFTCDCNAGFVADGSGTRSTCKDVDECVTDPGLCAHTCRNTWGSYQCTCEKGYQLTDDSRTCEDVDECAQYPDGGLCPGQCNNTPGSFTCSCPTGFDLMQDGRTCQDIDECRQQTADCQGTDKLCINTRGGHKCETIACPKGFVRAPSLGNANNQQGPVEDPWRSLLGMQADQADVGRRADRHGIAANRLTMDDTGVVCVRAVCEMGDIDCLLNRTKSVQYQYVSLPTVRRLAQPFVLITVHMVGHSIYRNVAFTIESGNRHDHFDVVQDYIGDGHASLRLLGPIRGPRTIIVRLRMDNRNRYESVISTHYAIIKLYVSQYSI